MRWLVLILLAVNALAWFADDLWMPARVQMVAEDRTLPRVSTLKLGAAVPDETREEVDSVDGESVETERPPPAPDSDPDPEPEPEPAPEPERTAASATPKPVCVRLGWFDTAEGARERYVSIGQPGENMTVLEQQRTLEPLHWVIIPPQPENQALALFNELQRKGVDSYLVTRGENTNAISLGLFESREAALRVLEAKKRQNLNAVLANFPRNQLSYALVFEVPPSADAEQGVGRLEDYRDDFEMVEISRCAGIATNPENP
jgi:hypothetical protein